MAIDKAKLRAAIEAINDLPALPTVVTKIIAQINNPSTNAADVGKLIEQDQSLTGRVLRLVNSAYYGFPRQIKTIQHAVVILGFAKVRTVILTTSVFGAFKNCRGERLDQARFWQHSLGTAVGAKTAAEMLGFSHAGEDAFVGGLLHDVGKMILDQFQPALYGPIFKHANDNGLLIFDVEMSAMGLSHATVGGWLTEKWLLPPDLVRMVEGHHAPGKQGDRKEVIAAIHIGDILARAMGVGSGGDNRMPAFDPAVVAAFSLSEKFVNAAVEKYLVDIGKARDFFALVEE
ncbi:MAG: HDOD domain-containing protein [Planctomycetota bacterium]|jgi:putative nucleotidyltransferase with HDIG domain|nr:HDOD domain-containing protein [Planctomycetota bacterium]